ncbi:hypothetical protein H704_00231 [Bartonella bacilliformis Peru38]|uniref:Uncharacterized protein n=2 Tax=Bartonella bacilliformis TaxID=774 RepID=A1URI2_BARBK|nr:hypothetical protein BARBAKC583_0253 [Bartonella bacilliformis KC583]EKS45886.1 hypothetical protein BbINS_01196 [Bartonella bacilliformis INS]EYS89388.1 hypothetical protein X472_00730 [Bartonella bacilliformis San Pedro600-02]KEG21464.1 hypothetical protein H704_00231 [Bartonella bacilliformis Peru38]
MSPSGLFYENSAARCHLVVGVIKVVFVERMVFYGNFLRSNVNMRIEST